jgi:3-hydroxyisobutyrate dehydrogenase-like beta-hydroxyacid dehydrogenase/alkylhydroperoxidase family enzyme
MKVGWIGLGNIGLTIAQRIAVAGHDVTAFDIHPPPAESLKGLRLARSAVDAAAGCELLAIAVFSDEQVAKLLLGADGLFGVVQAGAVVAVFTTGSIDNVRRWASSAPAGVAVLDTCFSRRHDLAGTGEMILLVGGDPAALDRCRTVFNAFAREIHHLGDSGAGRALKLVNNLLWVAHTQLTADALQLAEGLGLDRSTAARLLLECSGASDAQHVFVPPDWRATLDFMLPYMAKDATAGVEAAENAGVDLGALGSAVSRYAEHAPRSTAARAPTERLDGMVRARKTEILGHPPRIAPLTEWDEEMRALSVQAPPGHEHVRSILLSILLHNRGFVRAYREILPYFLAHGVLPPRVRELVILRTAWLLQVPFEWGEHVQLAKQAGLTTAEIERVTRGSEAEGWGEDDGAVIRAVEELIEDSMISDAVWQALTARLGPDLLVELVACVGQYQALGYLLNALRIPLSEGNSGLAAR